MTADDLHNFTRRRPFQPFRIHTTDATTYDVRHPDQAIPLRSRVVIGVGGDGSIPEAVEHLSLIHVVRIEELPADPSRRTV